MVRKSAYEYDVLCPTPEGTKKLGVVCRPTNMFDPVPGAGWEGRFFHLNGEYESKSELPRLSAKRRCFDWVVRTAEAHSESTCYRCRGLRF
jgi:hypothetical protein